MSDPKERHDSDELDLDAETVQDLEPGKDEAEDVRGGASFNCCSNIFNIASCIKPN